MGYLDNSSIIVDAILTKKGRELLSRQDGSFRITQFALADDEIDYTLYNENHPDGSAFYGEAIENLPLIEAIPNENNTMISNTLNFDSTIESGYIFTIADRRLIQAGTTSTGDGAAVPQSANIPFTGTALSQTFTGTTFTGTTLGGSTLFGANSALATSIIIVGLDTGARTTITLTVNKDSRAGTSAATTALTSY